VEQPTPFHLSIPAALRVAERLAGKGGERDFRMDLDHALLKAGLDFEDLLAESERLCRERG